MEQEVKFNINIPKEVRNPYYVVCGENNRLIFFGHFPSGNTPETLILFERRWMDKRLESRINHKIKILH